MRPEVYTQGKQKLPKILSKEQLLRTIRHIRDPSVVMGCFLSIFLGLRVGEVSYHSKLDSHPLRWEDVDLEIGEVTILDAKNPKRYKSGYGKDRIVPIFDELIPIFKMWKALNQGSQFVVPHQKNGNKPILTSHLQRILHEALDKEGLLQIDYYQTDGKPRYKYHFHTLRHVCATNLLRRGLKIEQVKEFLGHERLETTMVYLDMVKDDLKEAVTQAFAYPKKRNYFLPLQEPAIDLGMGLEALRLENENLKLKLQLHQVLTVRS